VSTLKIGTVHPLPLKLVRRLLESVDSVLVLEELEPFVEMQVKALIADMGKSIRVIGKTDGTLSRVGEYDNEIVAAALAKLVARPLDRSTLPWKRRGLKRKRLRRVGACLSAQGARIEVLIRL